MTDNWTYTLFLAGLLPLLVYICTKLAVYAFFKGRHQFYQDHPNDIKEREHAE